MTQAVGEFKLTTAVVIAAANSRWGSNKQKWAWYVSNERYPLCCTACIQWVKADRQGVFKRLILEQHANKLNKNKHLAGKDSASVPQRKSEKKKSRLTSLCSFLHLSAVTISWLSRVGMVSDLMTLGGGGGALNKPSSLWELLSLLLLDKMA